MISRWNCFPLVTAMLIKLKNCLQHALPTFGRKAGNVRLAKAGLRGKYKGNIRRDVMSYVRRHYVLLRTLRPYFVKCRFQSKDGIDVVEKAISMFLPHELFATIYHTDRQLFTNCFGSDEDRFTCWTTLRAPWWHEGHPAYHRVMRCPTKAVPIQRWH